MNENTRSQTELLLHPLRIRIVGEFAGHRRTVRDLAAALPDVAQATLYRHVAALAEAGILEQVDERAARGPSERIYRVAPGADRIGRDELDTLSGAEHQRMFAVFTASLIDSFAAYTGSGDAVPSADGVSYNRATVNLSSREREDFATRFAALAEDVLALPPAPHRRRYHLASCVIPGPAAVA